MVTGQHSTVCARCGCVPVGVEGDGTLYVWFPLGHSLGKGLLVLQQSGASFQAIHDKQCVLVQLSKAEMTPTVAALMGMFSTEETRDTRVLFMPNHNHPELDDFARTMSLFEFDTLLQSDWLLDILAHERVTSHFQPIVSAQHPEQVFAQEALLRGILNDGSLAPPGKMFDLARGANLLFQLDRVARLSAIRSAGRNEITSKVFVNFNPSSVYDPEYCLRSTVQAIDESGLERSQVVFEVVESDTYADTQHLLSILSYYRNAGFGVALDDFGSGYSSFNLLQQLKPDYIKLDMSLMRDVHLDPVKAIIVRKVLEIADQLDIMSVAEGIETAEELEWASANGASLVQGYFIARPAQEIILR